MPEAVIVSCARTPIGRAFKGSLRDMRPDDLAAAAVRAAMDHVPQIGLDDVDDLYLGCGLPGGEAGFNMGRVVAVKLGHDRLPAATLTRYCASSLQTTRMAAHAIKAGEGDVFVSAGVEAVSRYARGNSDALPDAAAAEVGGGWQNPAFDAARARSAATAGGADTWSDPRDDDALPDVYLAMGHTAENLALARGVSRAEMDEFAVRSQNLAEQAVGDGFWSAEITPLTLPDGTVVSADDSPRAGVTADSVSTLDPVFRPDGRVTAGNCCPLNDGAAAVVVTSDVKAAQLGLEPLARIVSTGVSAVSPEIMGIGPVEASRQALQRAGLSIQDMDLVEINEAFAAQVIPSYQDLGVPLERLNVHGGAVAVGHPFGMTGARITGTLLNGLRHVDGRYGLETMCVGGGQGMAMVLERL